MAGAASIRFLVTRGSPPGAELPSKSGRDGRSPGGALGNRSNDAEGSGDPEATVLLAVLRQDDGE
jgi:hypothetical protein